MMQFHTTMHPLFKYQKTVSPSPPDDNYTFLFADDTSMIITNPNPSNFEKCVNKIIQDINEWFNTNLSLNMDKTHFIHFVTKNSSSIDFNIIHGNNKIADVYNTKFLGLTLENTLS